MDRVHGRDWRRRAEAPLGRRPLHLLTSGLALAASAALVLGRRRAAVVAGAGWAILTADFSCATDPARPPRPRSRCSRC